MGRCKAWWLSLSLMGLGAFFTLWIGSKKAFDGCPDLILDWWVTFVMGMLQTWLLWDAAVIPVRNNLQQANTQEDRHGQVRGTSFSLETPA